MSLANVRRWRLPLWRRHRRTLPVLTGAALLASFLPTFGVSAGVGSTRLDAGTLADFTTNDAHVDETYNVGVMLDVIGAGSVEVVTARARRTSPGLEQRPPLLSWACDGKEGLGLAVGADLHDRPKVDIRDLSTPLRAAHGPCWVLLLRFVPRQFGNLHADGVEIVFQVGGRTQRQTFDFSTRYEVTKTGPDLRES